MSLPTPRRKGKISISIAPKAPGKREPPKVMATCDSIVLEGEIHEVGHVKNM